MNGLGQLRQLWGRLDTEQRKALAGILVTHALLVLLGLRSLARTPDDRLRGPRWLWKILMPSSTLKVDGDTIVFAPFGVTLFFLVGRRWRRSPWAE